MIVTEQLVGVFKAVSVIGGLGGALAILLTVAEAFLADYGECTVTINEEKKLTVQGGGSLLASLMNADIFVPSACGGRGSCGLCKLKVLEGGGPLLPTEEPHLSAEEISANLRVSCQVKVRSDMRIEIPEEFFRIKRYRGTCERVEDLTHDVKRVRIKLVEPESIEFKPGQYIQLEAPAYGENPDPVYRAYSIASAPTENGAIELLIRLVPGGICTTWVFTMLKEGDEVFCTGPHGEFYLRETDRDIVFAAGGTGLAPIRSILLTMAEQNNSRRATLYLGAVSQRDLFCVEEIRHLEAALPDFTYVPALSEPAEGAPWDGKVGLITEVIDRNEGDLSQKEAYLCGSPGMIDAVVKVLTAKGMPDGQIYYDKFA